MTNFSIFNFRYNRDGDPMVSSVDYRIGGMLNNVGTLVLSAKQDKDMKDFKKFCDDNDIEYSKFFDSDDIVVINHKNWKGKIEVKDVPSDLIKENFHEKGNKNLLSYQEFLSESRIFEGKLSKEADLSLSSFLSDVDTGENEELYKKFEKLLKSNRDEIFIVDSETYTDSPISKTIFKFLEKNFKMYSTLITDPKNQTEGMFAYYDPKLNVIRADDNGFVCFYFTKKSNF